MENDKKKYIKKTFLIEERLAHKFRIYAATLKVNQKDLINTLIEHIIMVDQKDINVDCES